MLACTGGRVTIAPWEPPRRSRHGRSERENDETPNILERYAAMSTLNVFDTLKSTLVEQFELDPAKITPEARLYEDLDLDSIIKLQELTGRKVSPEEFKGVRTVGDVQRVIEKLLSEPAKA